MIADYSEVTAGRQQRLSALDQALALEQWQAAHRMAYTDARQAKQLLEWIDKRIAAMSK